MAFLSLAALLVVNQTSIPTLSNSPTFSAFSDRWKTAMEGLRSPSISVVVVKGDEVVLLDSMGMRDPFSKKPANPDTMYYIASCTKTFTGLATVMLDAAGKLSIEDTVQKHLSQFRLKDPEQAKKMTLRDLLCHRPGLNSNGAVTLDAYTGEINDRRYFDFLSLESIKPKPEYSNVHFTLLGRVLEKIDKKGWKDVLQSRVFEPLGLTRTTAYASRMYSDENCAIPTMELRGIVSTSPLIKSDNTMHAAGGMGMSARDLGRYLRFMINEGRLDGKQIVPAESIRKMLKAEWSAPQGNIRKIEGFGLSWQVGTFRGRRYAAHGGGYQGASAYIAFLPDEKIGCAVLANGSTPIADIVSIDVLDKLLNYAGEDLLPSYLKGFVDIRERNRNLPEIGPNPAFGGLSQPLVKYEGVYENRMWGRIVVSTHGNMLRLKVGERDFLLRSTRKDEFEAFMYDADEPSKGRFVVEGGRVKSVEFQFGENVIFSRK